MCVILAVPADAEDITVSEWDKATHTNADGYGIAWLDDGMVRFKKYGYEESKKLREWRPPKPYVMHFRLATVGAERPELCHPFIVSPKSKLTRSGRAHEVLFHNGHWGEWAEWLALTYSGLGKLPKGEFSDSRAMASMVGHYGPDILEYSGAEYGQKIVLFDKAGRFRFFGNGWAHDKGDGVTRSNEMHLWGNSYGSYYYDQSEVGWMQQAATKAATENTELGNCSICQETYLTYQEDEDGMCYRCDNWGGTAYTLPTTTKEYEKIRHCVGCGLQNLNNLNICSECEKEDLKFKCQICDKSLFVENSIASQACETCRAKPDMNWWRLQSNLWFAVKNHLKGWTTTVEGKGEVPVWPIPSTFSVHEAEKGDGWEYMLVGHSGYGDVKESMYFEGTINKTFSSITSSLLQWDKDEEEIKKALLART